MGRPRKNPVPEPKAPPKKAPMVVKPKAEPVEAPPAVPSTNLGLILTTVPCIMCGGPMLVTAADYVSGVDNSKCPFCAVSPAVYLAPEVVNALMKAGINIAVGAPPTAPVKAAPVEYCLDPDNFGEAADAEDPEFEMDGEFGSEEEDEPAPPPAPKKKPAEDEDEDWL